MATFFKSLFAILLSFIVSIVVLIALLGALIVGAAEYFAPPVEAPKQGSILEVNLSQEITDSPRQLPLINLSTMSIDTSSPLSLLSTLRALEAAASDPSITALSLRMDGLYELPLAMTEELRDAVVRFKKSSGKPVYSYSQSLMQSNYYLASAADSLYLEPLGTIEWRGIATSGFYFGDLLKGLGVDVEVFRPTECRYKSAVEPYIYATQSNESREQSQRLVDELWRGVVGQVATDREVSAERLRELAREVVMIDSETALKERLVDAVAYADEYELALERCGVMRNKSGEIRRISLWNYASMQQQAADKENITDVTNDKKVAIVYADGILMDGRSEPGSEPIVGDYTLSRQLRKCLNDDDIKAVVLRVNSPGGSALSADVVWREVELLRAKKPVVVSMGSYAASGGYYISVPADMIVADRYTITGSIGVYSVMFNYVDALSKHLKVNYESVGSEPSADFGVSPRGLNSVEREAMLRGVDDVYGSFTEKVAAGRNLPIGVVSTLAGGRTWSGVEAAACGLVDAVGGLHSAISLAVERSTLYGTDYQIIEITDEPSGFEMVRSMLSVQVRELFNIGGASDAMVHLKRIESMQNNMIMHHPERVQF